MEGLDEQLSATRRSAAELFAAQMHAHARPASQARQTAQEAAGRAGSGGSLSSWLSSAAGALLGRAAGSPSESAPERHAAAFSPPHTPAPAATQRSSARLECPYGVGDAVLYRGARGSEEARVTAVDWLDDATPSFTLRCAADGRQLETVLSRLQPLRETAAQRAAQEAADAELARALQAEEDATEAQAAQAPVSMQQMLLQMLNAAAQGAHNPQNPAATRFEIPGVPGASITFSTSAAPMPAAGVGMFPFGPLFGGAGLAPLFGGLGGGEMSYEELLALQERMGGAQAAGASAQQISALPTRHYAARDGGEDTCSICLSTFEEGEELRVLPCAHGFHRGCVDRWLGTRKQCPCCRAEL